MGYPITNSFYAYVDYVSASLNPLFWGPEFSSKDMGDGVSRLLITVSIESQCNRRVLMGSSTEDTETYFWSAGCHDLKAYFLFFSLPILLLT